MHKMRSQNIIMIFKFMNMEQTEIGKKDQSGIDKSETDSKSGTHSNSKEIKSFPPTLIC